MPPKKRIRSTIQKPRIKITKPKPAKEDEVDTTFYEVEKIVGSKVKNGTIMYEVKWKDWPSSANTWEPEYRLNCDNKLLEFALKHVDPKKDTTHLQAILKRIKDGVEVHVTQKIDPLSTIAQTTVQTGTVKFVCKNTVETKKAYLKHLYENHQYYLLHSVILPTETEVDACHKTYADQFRYRLEVFPEYPQVEVVLPLKSELVFYPPPPLSNLLFEPVTEEMLSRRSSNEHLFPPESDELGFNDTHSFIHPDYFDRKPAEDPRFYHNDHLIDRMERSDFANDPRFGVNLKLQQEAARGWTLYSAHRVEANTPLMMMTGVIRPGSAALDCLKREGEAVAFSSFIEIPGTGKCLDRRQFHDFSKYIPHSCNPTCSVRLVHSGNEIPDLVVYSIVALDAFNSMAITLDYYKGFTEDVKEYFKKKNLTDNKIFDLYEEEIDFVHCQCLSQHCREVLYVDRSLKRADKTAKKSSKLMELDPEFEFHGMKVADPNKFWNINDYAFQY